MIRAPAHSYKILYILNHAGFIRNFESLIRNMLKSNFNIHILLLKKHSSIKIQDYPFLNSSNKLSFSFFNHEELDLNDKFYILSRKIRLIRNAIHYTNKPFRTNKHIISRFISLQKKNTYTKEELLAIYNHISKMSTLKRKLYDRYLALYDRFVIKPSDVVLDLIHTLNPDYAIFSPLITFHSHEIDFLKAVKYLKIPSLLSTASWDNLTNKGKIIIKPDKVAVWNKHMAKEANQLHSIPRRNIWITGALVFEPWFNHSPSQSRTSFLRNLGLNPNKLLIVYLCSSGSISENKETLLIKKWITEIRHAVNYNIREANILIRPHPMARSCWQEEIIDSTNNNPRFHSAVIFPFNTKHPTSTASRAIFFDTLFYADRIVGLNTSCMLEAAICKKPVYTYKNHIAEVSQTSNIHYQYIKKSKFISESSNISSHIDKLTKNVNASLQEIACQDFISEFILPFNKVSLPSKLLIRHILKELKKSFFCRFFFRTKSFARCGSKLIKCILSSKYFSSGIY